MDKQELIYTFNENDSVYVLTEILRKRCGVHNGLATSITNALYRNKTADYKTLGKIKEALSSEEGKKELLKTKYFGEKGMRVLEDTMKFVNVMETPKPEEPEEKRVHVAMDKRERGYYKASFHPAEPGWKYVGKVIGEVDILLNIPTGNGYEQKRVVLTCNGSERGRCIFVEEPLKDILDKPLFHVGFIFRGDCYFRTSICIRDRHDNTEYIYNIKHIVSIKKTDYKVYIRDTDNTEEE